MSIRLQICLRTDNNIFKLANSARTNNFAIETCKKNLKTAFFFLFTY